LADIIITSELFELRLGNWVGAKTKILAEAPYNPEELFLKSRPQRDKVQVFGIWTEEDLTFNEKILEAIYPSQEELFMVFHYLASIHTIKTQSKQQVINLLQRSYPNLQRATLQYVLDIVLELQNQTDQKDFADFSKTKVFELAELEKQSLMDLKNILAEEEQILTDYFLAGNS